MEIYVCVIAHGKLERRLSFSLCKRGHDFDRILSVIFI